MRVRHVILDWSGTLVNDLPTVFQANNHVFTTFGLAPLTLEEFRRDFCLPVRKFYDRYLPDVSRPRLAEVFASRYHQLHHETSILPLTLDFLQFCRESGRPVFIATAVDGPVYERQARDFGIDPFVVRAYTGLSDKTEVIHQIIADNQLTPSETLFVGDMVHDIEAGRTGGLRTCAVLTGYTESDKLRAAEPDWVCRHLGELQKLLSQEMAHG